MGFTIQIVAPNKVNPAKANTTKNGLSNCMISLKGIEWCCVNMPLMSPVSIKVTQNTSRDI